MGKMKQKLAIFLSGGGSNARAICKYFNMHEQIEVALLCSNSVNSGVKSISAEFGIPHYIFTRDEFYKSDHVLNILNDHQINVLVLAGFLWLIPENLLKQYSGKIINIHPALLPKYGGKGMHGIHVHNVVFENKDKVSGVTIHLCNEKYDEGKILFQQSVELNEGDLPETIAKKVLQLEHEYYPKVIEQFLTEKK